MLVYSRCESLAALVTALDAGAKVLAAGGTSLDAVTAGVLQAQASWPGYWTGKDAGLAVPRIVVTVAARNPALSEDGAKVVYNSQGG